MNRTRMKRACGVVLAAVLLLCTLLPGCAAKEAAVRPGASENVDAGSLGVLVIPAREEESAPEPAALPEQTEPTEQAEPADAAPDETETAEVFVPADPVEEKVQALLSTMTLEERVGQMFLVGCPASGAEEVLEQYPLGGWFLFSSALSGLTAEQAREKLAGFQARAKIPLLIGVDEEGGTVTRVSSNPNLRDTKFRSPRTLLSEGGMELVLADAHEKSQLLLSLGINVNLGPVCDVTGDPDAFMYARSISGDPEVVTDYVSRVTESMCADGIGCVLKHFPGYGVCGDTHEEVIRDRSEAAAFAEINLPPFRAGAEHGAGAVMVCHNIVEAYDDTLPASLSPAVHKLLRQELGDDIVVMTDDLDMKGITAYTDGNSAVVQAVLAGNDMLLTSDYRANFKEMLDAVEIGTIPEPMVDAAAARILRWKIALGLIEA